MALNSIAQEWAGFAAMVFRDIDPPVNQKLEMRKAFFAGAWAMFTATEEIGMPHVSEDEAMQYLESIREECKAFKTALMRDYAETN